MTKCNQTVQANSWSQNWNMINKYSLQTTRIGKVWWSARQLFSSEDASVTDLCVQTAFGYTKEEYIKFLFLNAIFQQPSKTTEETDWSWWSSAGLTGTVPNWTCTVCISEWCAKWAKQKDMMSVPQGSVELGPIKFCIFTIPWGHYKINYQYMPRWHSDILYFPN